MNLRSIDLNLLVVLDALLEEEHVGRAAERIGLSQPATSAALARCRQIFGDALLERRSGGMRPTSRAEALRAPLKALVADAAALVGPSEIVVSTVERRVRLGIADYPASAMLPALASRLAREAPGIELVIAPWQGLAVARRMLVDGDLDLAVSVFAEGDDELVVRDLLADRYVVAMRAEHPIARTSLDLEVWLGQGHVVVSGRGEARTAVDAALAGEGHSRRVAVTVPGFSLVPPILRSTDLVALLPATLVEHEAGLVAVDPPLATGLLEVRLASHRRRAGDPVLRYMAELIAEVVGNAQK